MILRFCLKSYVICYCPIPNYLFIWFTLLVSVKNKRVPRTITVLFYPTRFCSTKTSAHTPTVNIILSQCVKTLRCGLRHVLLGKATHRNLSLNLSSTLWLINFSKSYAAEICLDILWYHVYFSNSYFANRISVTDVYLPCWRTAMLILALVNTRSCSP